MPARLSRIKTVIYFEWNRWSRSFVVSRTTSKPRATTSGRPVFCVGGTRCWLANCARFARPEFLWGCSGLRCLESSFRAVFVAFSRCRTSRTLPHGESDLRWHGGKKFPPVIEFKNYKNRGLKVCLDSGQKIISSCWFCLLQVWLSQRLLCQFAFWQFAQS